MILTSDERAGLPIHLKLEHIALTAPKTKLPDMCPAQSLMLNGQLLAVSLYYLNLREDKKTEPFNDSISRRNGARLHWLVT